MNQKHPTSCSLLNEFENLSLGDRRLDRRFNKICSAFSQKPGSIINHAITNFHECKAAYRFWDNAKVSSFKIMNSHRQAITQKLNVHDKYVLEIQDSSELNFSSHLKVEGVGPIAEGKYLRGLEMHTSLLVTPSGLPLGIASTNIWAREETNPNKGKDYHFIPWENKESIKWATALEDADKIDFKGMTRVLVADREADFFELLNKLETEERKMIIRLRWDRKVNQSDLSVKDIIDQQPISGSFEINIAAKGGPNFRQERQALLAVKFASVDLIFKRKVKHNSKKISVTIVRAKEMNSTEGDDSLEWYLITNIAVNNAEEAKQVVKFYSKRWMIEEFHKILKGGLKIEDARLSNGEKLQKFISFLTIVSLRLLWISRVNRIDPTLPCTIAFSEAEWKIAYQKVYSKKKEDGEIPTISEIVKATAMLGGYFGRKQDGPPGVMTLWRGLMRLHEIVEAVLDRDLYSV